MTPADRLLAAAELLEQRADAALVEADVDDGWDYVYGRGDACGIYATTVSPEVGKLVAACLRADAKAARFMTTSTPAGAFRRPLALADLLLAGES